MQDHFLDMFDNNDMQVLSVNWVKAATHYEDGALNEKCLAYAKALATALDAFTTGTRVIWGVVGCGFFVVWFFLLSLSLNKNRCQKRL